MSSKNGLRPGYRRSNERAVFMPDWPGITTGHTAECTCTWALFRGVYQVKRIHAACLITDHVKVASARRGVPSIP